jgi:hypothetical protein
MSNYPLPYAYRVRYAELGLAKHRVQASRSPLRWLRSRIRDLGDVLVGAFALDGATA